MCILILLLLVERLDAAASSLPRRYRHPSETDSLDCGGFFRQTILDAGEGTNRNVDLNEYRENRVAYPEAENWASFGMECEAIFRRTYFQREDLYPEEKQFPIAISRTVYKDYRMIEMELGATYAPQNHYCFAVDANSSPLFHNRMRHLADCLPNVYLAPLSYAVDSIGHNISQSEWECLRFLAQPQFDWKYVISTQNHDVSLRTNQELIQIFKWMNGTNDLPMSRVAGHRWTSSDDWSFEKIQFFKNESKNNEYHYGFPPSMVFAMSRSTAALSRPAVDFLVETINVDRFLAELSARVANSAELFMGSMNAADVVDLPGGFTHHCLREEVPDYFVSRFTIWDGSYCATDMWRHGICTLGMEHLNELQYSPQLFANKFLPDSDFGAVACWHEYLFNRTHFERGTMRLDPRKYTDPPHVRFHMEKGSPKFDPRSFDCERAMTVTSSGRAVTVSYRLGFIISIIFILIRKFR